MDTIFDLPHGESNPRNSEGSFIQLTDGRILFVYTRYNGESWSDHASADLAALLSEDDGRSWGKSRIVRRNDAMNVMSVSLLRLLDGRIALMYLRKSELPEGRCDCRPWLCFSSDEGESWSNPQEVTGLPPVYLVVNNDRLVQLRSGRLLIPAALHRFKKDGWDTRAIALFFLSDDAGQTWREATEWVLPPCKLTSGFQEPGVCELADGSLIAFFRTSDGTHYQSWSSDGGESWTAPEKAWHFPSSASPLSMKADPNTGELVAVWSDRDPRWGIQPQEDSWNRTPLVLARSNDQGKTWHSHRMLENQPDHGYCYTAMLFTERALLLAYCCGGGNNSKVLQDLRIRRIEIRYDA